MGRRSYHAPTSSLLYIFGIAYIGLLLLFAWQTIEFVNWLFPDELLIFKILTFVCFDVMAFLWAVADLFYHFTDYAARTWVRYGWGVTFALSLIASVLYLAIQGYFRFHLVITGDMLNVGYTVSIVALVFNILVLTGFLYREITAISNAVSQHKRYVRRKTSVTPHNGSETGVTQAQLPQNASVTPRNVTPLRTRNAVRQQRYRDRRKKGFIR